MNDSKFHLEILPPPQRKLWDELVSLPEEFTLYGGTAIALHLGHRESVDFDFFGKKFFNPMELLSIIPFLKNGNVLQSEPNTLTTSVDRSGPVKLSFFGVPNISPLVPPLVSADNGLKVASLLDLAGMKVSVVQVRAEVKDYIDLHAIFENGQIDLHTALAAGVAIYGKNFNPQNTLKALCYFEDGNVAQLSDSIKRKLVKLASSVDLNSLPILKFP